MSNRPVGMRTLHEVAYAGNLELVRRYVTEGDNLEERCTVCPNEDETPLCLAVKARNTRVVHFLLEQAANPNAPGQYGTRPLQASLEGANWEIIRLLLEYGADVNAADDRGSHALLDVAWRSERDPWRAWGEITRLLIEAGGDVNAGDLSEKTPLEAALRYGAGDAGNREIIRILMEAGAKLEIDAGTGVDGGTALMYAVWMRKSASVEMLLELGANVNQTDEDGNTAWNQALRMGYTEIAERLEKAGAVVPVEVMRDLHQALLWGKTEAVANLLAEGVDVNQRNRNGEAPLLVAIDHWGKEEIVRLLLDHGANMEATRDSGHTPLSLAVESAWPQQDPIGIVKLLLERGADVSAINLGSLVSRGKPSIDSEIVRLLMDAGADVNAADWEGWTILMRAAWSGDTAYVALLLDRRADVNARTITSPASDYFGGYTPLTCAVQAFHLEVARLLLDHGADIDSQDNSGHTALMDAMRIHQGGSADDLQNSIAVIQLLLERGANVNLKNHYGYGYTALDKALDTGREEIVRMLEQAGAIRGDAGRSYYGPVSVEEQENLEYMKVDANISSPTLKENQSR